MLKNIVFEYALYIVLFHIGLTKSQIILYDLQLTQVRKSSYGMLST